MVPAHLARASGKLMCPGPQTPEAGGDKIFEFQPQDMEYRLGGILGEISSGRPPDYSSDLCPPKTFAI